MAAGLRAGGRAAGGRRGKPSARTLVAAAGALWLAVVPFVASLQGPYGGLLWFYFLAGAIFLPLAFAAWRAPRPWCIAAGSVALALPLLMLTTYGSSLATYLIPAGAAFLVAALLPRAGVHSPAPAT